ncbi:SLAM family member 7-like [Chanodichthys erythropterus]|uniref:SLAM family member 7-like n=1 Tax=Chanodichthys erythropterus TaxID=933992 RepID=UPI00351EAA65
MALTHLLLTFVVMFTSPVNSNTVSSDIIQPSAMPAQKGGSVQLSVQLTVQANETAFDDLDWLKDNTVVVVSYNFNNVNIHPSYKDRVYFNTGNYSLTLKNIQDADSGIYRARANGHSEYTIGLYNVTVGTSSHGSTTGSVSLTWIIFLFLLGVMMI